MNSSPSSKQVSSILAKLLKKLAIPYTSFYLQEQVKKYGEGETLANITTLLAKYRIDALAVQIGIGELTEIPLPALLVSKEEEEKYYILEEIKETGVILSDSQDKKRQILFSELEKIWEGYTLLIQKNENSQETNLETHLEAQKKAGVFKILKNSLAFFLAFVSIFLLSKKLFTGGLEIQTSFYYAAFYVLHSCGFVLSGVLLSGEVFTNNFFLEKACAAFGIASDCSNKEETNKKLPFSWLSWAEIGIYYFVGSFLFLLLGGSKSYIFLQSTFASLGILGVLYSLYYQKFVQKKWCSLCLAVMLVLTLEAGLGISFLVQNDFKFNPNWLSSLLYASFAYLLPVFVWHVVKPFLVQFQKNEQNLKQSLAFKYNFNTFNSLLKAQRKVDISDIPQHFESANLESELSFVMVTRPTCPPCKQAKKDIKKLVNNFGEYFKLTTCQLILVKKDFEIVSKELGDKYSEEQKKKVTEEHSNWISKNQINHTPAYLINGHLMPEGYQLLDLDHFLLSLSNEMEEGG